MERDFDEAFGGSYLNRDLAIAEQRDDEARQAAESPDAPSIIKAADELVSDELAALKQSLRSNLAGRGIACGISAGRMLMDSDLSDGLRPASYSVTLYLTPTVTLGGSGHTIHECENDTLHKLDIMLGEAQPFRIVPQKDEGPRAA